MAINDIVQTIAEARVDARSLSEFVFKPAGFKVARRLAPTVDTLQFYINRFNSLNGDFSSSVSVALSSLNNSVAEADGKVAYIETTVQDAINQSILSSGFVTIDSFELGATITQRNQALRHAVDGKLYRWAGDLPKDVPANSTPVSTGGLGANAWLEVSDATLRQDFSNLQQDLTNPDIGALMVRGSVVYVGTLAERDALPTSSLTNGQVVMVASSSGGEYVWNGKFVPRNSSSKTYLIPEDFPTLQAAFDSLSSSKIASSGRVILRISSGHVIQDSLSLKGGDYSSFMIRAADAEVNVGTGMTGTLFTFEQCIAPTIACLFNQNGHGGGGVLFLTSFGFMYPGSGVKNAGARGLEVATSVVDANNTIWDGAGGRGVRCSNAGSLKIRDASAQGCGGEGLAVSDAAVSAQNSNFSNNALDNVIIMSGSRACLHQITATGSQGYNLMVAGGSVVDANQAILTGAGSYGIHVTTGGHLYAGRCDTRGSTAGGARVTIGGSANLYAATMSDASSPSGYYGILAESGSRVFAKDAICNNTSGIGVYSEGSSHVIFDGGSALECGEGSYGVILGGSINAIGSQGMPTSPTYFPVYNSISARGYILSDIKTRAQGVGTITAESTSVTINPGLDVSPRPEDAHVTLRSSLGGATAIWVSDVSDSALTVQVDTAPTSDVTFNWVIRSREV